MSYDLHITRAPECWSDNQAHQIAESEWLTLVEGDGDLRLARPGDEYYMKGMALWTRKLEGSSGPWLCWARGNVYSKNPNGPIIAKMLEIAVALQARVQGDDCEIYVPDGRVLQENGEYQREVDWRKW